MRSHGALSNVPHLTLILYTGFPLGIWECEVVRRKLSKAPLEQWFRQPAVQLSFARPVSKNDGQNFHRRLSKYKWSRALTLSSFLHTDCNDNADMYRRVIAMCPTLSVLFFVCLTFPNLAINYLVMSNLLGDSNAVCVWAWLTPQDLRSKPHPSFLLKKFDRMKWRGPCSLSVLDRALVW